LHGGPARVTKKGDLVDAVALDFRVDDEPALDIGRTDEARADRIARRAGSALARHDELRAKETRAVGRVDLEIDAGTVLGEPGHIVREQRACGSETLQAFEQRALETRLVECPERGMAVGAARRVHLHQLRTARAQRAGDRMPDAPGGAGQQHGGARDLHEL